MIVMELRDMIEAHVRNTGSEKGQEILDHFDEYLPKFKKIIPARLQADADSHRPDGGKGPEQSSRHRLKHSMRMQREVRRGNSHGKTNWIFGI